MMVRTPSPGVFHPDADPEKGLGSQQRTAPGRERKADMEDEHSHSGRDETDESLRSERTDADQAILEQRHSIEGDADEEIERAREAADSRLDRARAEVDRRSGPPSASVREERAREDQILDEQRGVSDEQLRGEREAQARALASLLPLEREKTDWNLLTERARSDIQLEHRDDFLGMVSHDLRSLLCAVLMETGTLSDEASDSDEGRRTVAAVHRLERYVARMNRLIGDLVDIVAIEAGKLTIQPRSNDAGALLAETVEAFAPVAAAKEIDLALETGRAALVASFDHDRILQVLANLLANALKFTTPGGRILIRGEHVGDELEFCVSDTGMGIPAHMQETVFELFSQVRDSHRGGLGLGLHISKCIVEAHGGRIWAESREGEGSSFHFTLPSAAA